MKKPIEQWRPHEHPDYDHTLEEISNLELLSLKRSTPSFLKDPRPTHKRLYSNLTPVDFSEYAGTFRGTLGTSLEFRQLSPPPLGEQKGVMEFVSPDKVGHYFSLLHPTIENIETNGSCGSPDVQFSLAAKLFYTFGLVHPFLDGNGHIQRLMFAASVFQGGSLALCPDWTIHPRAYDMEMAEAFNGDDRSDAVARVLRAYVNFV